jgi:hypothetical protein
MASAVGGYLAARLRTRWIGLHTNEVFFRDTANGLIAWAFATLLTAGALTAVTAHIASGGLAGAGAAAGQAAQPTNPAEIYVDRLFRAEPTSAGAGQSGSQDSRAEVLRLWTASFRSGNDLSAADRAYVTRLVAARTGLSPTEAQQRVDEVITEAKANADKARKAAAQFSFWLTASLLLGALAASLAAVEGGQLRDGTWNDRVLTPRTL